jgi:hypothetical protein
MIRTHTHTLSLSLLWQLDYARLLDIHKEDYRAFECCRKVQCSMEVALACSSITKVANSHIVLLAMKMTLRIRHANSLRNLSGLQIEHTPQVAKRTSC